jgi:hypothetical protein
MIRFACPACGKHLQIADHGAGLKVPCPGCGQRLQVPSPATPAGRDKTVLGESLPPVDRSTPAAAAPAEPAAKRPAGTVPATCPGCGRAIPLQPHELSWTIECACCSTWFVPSATSAPAQPPARTTAAAPRVLGEFLRRVGVRPEWWQGLKPGARTGLLALSVTLGGLVALGLLALAITAPETLAYLLGAAVAALLGLGGAAGLAFLVAWQSSIGTECPHCGRWWAAVFLGEHIVEEKKGYGLVTRHAYSDSTGWVSGTSSHPGRLTGTWSTTRWRERVPVIRITYKEHWACKYCPARWTEMRERQVEDFDIPR